MKTALLFLFFFTLQSFAITSETRYLKVRDSHLIFDDKLEPREVAITFAGKMNLTVVKKILDRLDKEKLRAHFFVTGDDATNNSDIIFEILSKNHVLGSQGLNDPMNRTRMTTESSLSVEIQTGHEAVFSSVGYVFPFIRLSPRQGSIAVREMIKESGAFAFYWNVEYFADKPAQSIRDNLKRENYRGIVALTLSKDSTVEALDALIEEIKKEDLTVVTIVPNEESGWMDNPPLIRKSMREEVLKNGSIYFRKYQNQGLGYAI